MPRAAGHGRAIGHFVRHLLEMVVAMLLGMFLLGPVWPVCWPGLADAGMAVQSCVMATDMAIGMGVWMRLRGHSWRAIAEMSAAMYLPFAVLLPLYWGGLLSAGTVMIAGHVLMLPAMVAAMLLRRGEYTGSHAGHGSIRGRS